MLERLRGSVAAGDHDRRPQGGGRSECSADLGTSTRSDGTKQVTYKGHPLYYYVGDPNSGETSGQGINSFGAPWYVLSPSGSAVK